MNSFKALEKIVNTKRMGHAYIFSGSNNEILTNAVNKFTELLNVKNEDIFAVNGFDEEIKIKDIREFQKKLRLSPLFSEYKIGVLYGAENLNLESANAMLKILEEPSGKTVIILATILPQILLPTILSRAQLLCFFGAENKNIDVKSKILGQELSGKYDYIEKLSKEDKKEILKTLDDWLVFFRGEFLKDVTNAKMRLFLKNLINAGFYIKTTNINPRLTLEALILDL